MSRSRLHRFEKLRRLKQNEYDRLVFLAGRIQMLIQQLERQLDQVRRQQAATQHIPDDHLSLTTLAQCQHSLQHWHEVQTSLEQRDRELKDQLARTNQAVREHRGKLEAWDRLIEKERQKQAQEALVREMAWADEQYLMNQFTRSES